MAKGSTRLAIVEQALADTLDRLDELPADARTRALRAQATALQRVVQTWPHQPPSDTQRSAMVDLVLQLNIAVMKAAEESGSL